MNITTNKFEDLEYAFNQLLKNNIYGHLNKNSMVYILRGNYFEYNISCYENVYVFEIIRGDKLLAYRPILELKKYLYTELNVQENLKRIESLQFEVMEEQFLYDITLLDESIFTKNTVEYITALANKLDICLNNSDFIYLYNEKYSYIMYEKIEQYCRFVNEHFHKIISLFYLIQVIYSHVPLEEYKELVSKYVKYNGQKNVTDYSNEYVQKIANDMISKM